MKPWNPSLLAPKRIRKEKTMITQVIPREGLHTVGQIVATNALLFHAKEDGPEIAVALLSTHTAGAPVVDQQGQYVGFINEFDVMRALDERKTLDGLTAEDIMRRDQLTVTSSTRIVDAAKLMEQHHVVNLPVEEDGIVAYSVSRHDLLRARIGFGVGMGIDP
jgi:predicted transcriptional regulator